MFIRTVLGDIDPADFGRCLPHEHLLGQPPPHLATPDLQLTDLDAAIREVEAFQTVGGRSIVEMTTPDYGRDAAGLRRIAEATGVHIVAATGYNKETFSAPFLDGVSVAELVERYVREVEAGMDGTDIRTGLIKASTMTTMTPHGATMLQAAAEAHHRTGAPISTHTEKGRLGVAQAQALIDAGVKPEHIVIGHTDHQLDWGYHAELAATGVFLGIDQIGKAKYAPDADRIAFIQRHIDAGHGEQLLLSGDLARRSYWTAHGGAPGFGYILTDFASALRAAGLTDSDLDRLFIANPARAFAFGQSA
ncbi:MAG: phosphotriesterase-related protein [Bacteroidota bacterium]